MNADAIVKALKCCNVPSGRACSECPYHEVGEKCRTKRNKDAAELIVKLAQESQKWQEAYDCADSACRELSSKCDELTEENEKLNERINREARCQYDLCGQIVTLRDDVKYIKADTVQKIQERLRAETITIQDHIGNLGSVILVSAVDQIAKEMLEENNV